MSLEDLSKEELFSYAKELEEKLKRKTKYGLVWEDKSEDVVLECETKYPILKNIKERSIRNDTTSPVNVLIEGDNYHALQILNYTHKGKVDVIYIDPPYNTGNKDFIYNDNFVDGEDGYRHSKWLSFMERRLKLAKDLLKDTGVIFISIDDNEQAQLRLLCDGVFGEGNFVNNISVKTSEVSGVKMTHTSKKLPKIKEYILVYSKLPYVIKLDPVKINKTDDINKFKSYSKYYSNIILNKEDNVSNWKIISIIDYLKNKKISEDDLLNFKIENADKIVYRTNNKSFSKYTFDTKIAKIISPTGLEYVWWEGKQMLFLSDYLDEGICDLWTDISTINLNKEILELNTFSNGQKPLALIERVMKLAGNKNALILDFFAGSGTTGHAVLDLNKEDGGNRQFILVTNNGDEKSEHKIAENITYERLKRVMNGYKNKKGEQVEGLGGNLEYLKCDFIDRVKHEDNMKFNLSKNSTDLISLKEGIFDINITKPSYKIINNTAHSTAIYYGIDDVDLDNMYKDLEKFAGTKSAYIFSLGNPKETIEKLKEWKNINIEEMPSIK